MTSLVRALQSASGVLGTLSPTEIETLLASSVVARIGCHAEGRTYVVPVTYVYDGKAVIVQSAEGLKVRMMRLNPLVCVQVDHIDDLANWRSVIAWGRFEELAGTDAAAALVRLRQRLHPMLVSETIPGANTLNEGETRVARNGHASVYRIHLRKDRAIRASLTPPMTSRGKMTMQLTPTITFRGIAPSDTLEAEIRQRIDRLETYYGSIMGCRVLVEYLQRHHQSGNRFHVRIDLTVPGEEIVIAHEGGLHATAQDAESMKATKAGEVGPERKHAVVAVREAFDLARRRLQDYARRQRGAVKRPSAQAQGRIARLFPIDEYGYIEAEDGHEVYFQKSSVLKNAFKSPGRREQGIVRRGSRREGAAGQHGEALASSPARTVIVCRCRACGELKARISAPPEESRPPPRPTPGKSRGSDTRSRTEGPASRGRRLHPLPD